MPKRVFYQFFTINYFIFNSFPKKKLKQNRFKHLFEIVVNFIVIKIKRLGIEIFIFV